jgi:hypothetical protein
MARIELEATAYYVAAEAFTNATKHAKACGAAAQGAGVPVPRWSRTIATACRWLSPEPAANT